MTASNLERKVYLWRILAIPNPADVDKPVTLEEIVSILVTEREAGRARVYLSNGRILDDDDADRDEKNQLYIAEIDQDLSSATVTILVNRGDPAAVSPAFINSSGHVRVEHPASDEAPGYSAHMVISMKHEKGRHRALFEKMPLVSSALVLAALDKIIARAVKGNPSYLYERTNKSGVRDVKSIRPYRPSLDAARIPSETLSNDLEQGELKQIILTRANVFYSGPGIDDLVTRQEEKVILTIKHSTKQKIRNAVEAIVQKAKDSKFEKISFHLEKLPGNMTNNPTIPLDDHDALEQLYVRAKRLTGFVHVLDGHLQKPMRIAPDLIH